MRRRPNTGFSMIGMLITMVCIVVLFVIGMNAMNKAVTGQGSAVKGTVRSTQDQVNFYALHQSLYVNAMDTGGRYITPGEMGGGNDPSKNTTANLFSAMVAGNYITPSQLISGNEFNPGVYADDDYNHYAYDPVAGVFWDESFVADLDRDSNVSFAHMPLHGERFRRFWQTHSPSGVAVFGNRGPKDGIDDPVGSYTYGNNQTWGGHILRGDGSITFVNAFSPGDIFLEVSGQRKPDNIFAVDDGIDGRDSILAFTKEMKRDGPTLQYD